MPFLDDGDRDDQWLHSKHLSPWCPRGPPILELVSGNVRGASIRIFMWFLVRFSLIFVKNGDCGGPEVDILCFEHCFLSLFTLVYSLVPAWPPYLVLNSIWGYIYIAETRKKCDGAMHSPILGSSTFNPQGWRENNLGRIFLAVWRVIYKHGEVHCLLPVNFARLEEITRHKKCCSFELSKRGALVA